MPSASAFASDRSLQRRLLGAFAGKAQAAGFTVIRAAAYPGDVQSFAGLLLDLASDPGGIAALVPDRDHLTPRQL